MFKMTFYRKFEAAHRLIEGENGNTICAQPHGHTWQIRAHLSPTSDVRLNNQENTIALFSKVKKDWHNFIDNHIDHSFIFNHRDPLLDFMREQLPGGRHVVVPGDPTTEIVSVVLKSKLDAILKVSGLELMCESMEVNETQTNCVTFSGNPFEQLPKGSNPETYWWNRPDMTTNDLKV